MESRTRAVLRYTVVVPAAVVLVGLAAGRWTAVQFDVVVFALTVAAVLFWLAMTLTDDGLVVTENTDSFGLSRDGAWNRGDPAGNRESFGAPYRLYVSLVVAAVVGWAVLLFG